MLYVVALALLMAGGTGGPGGDEAPQTAAPVKLIVDHATAGVKPGDVVLLTVTAPVEMLHVRARVFDKVIEMWSDDRGLAWRALAGVDVATAPGSYTVIVEGQTAQGDEASAVSVLNVTRKVFGVRNLRVDPKFAEPPASVIERIQREARQLNEIWGTTTDGYHWMPPVTEPVSEPPNSSFGVRSVFNGIERSRHNGTDFPSPRGTPVHAPAGGQVVLAEPLYFTGNTVIIDHGQGLYSLMAHLDSTAVEQGATVTRGALLGTVGSTGRSTGPHLHWSVRLHGARVDPMSLVAIAPAPAALSPGPSR
jgi:murein DD-endopeptidase MepM/ murein hydrolase activator NlpD